jgi:hypothetical protein
MKSILTCFACALLFVGSIQAFEGPSGIPQGPDSTGMPIPDGWGDEGGNGSSGGDITR